MNQLLTVRDLSAYAQIHPTTIYEWVRSGEIPYIRRAGLGIRFRQEDVDNWISHQATKASAILEQLPRIDLSLEAYDRLYLGGEKVTSEGKTWTYPFGSVYLRHSKSGDRYYIYYRVSGKRIREVVKHAQTRAEALKVLTSKVADAFRGKYGFEKAEKREDTLLVDFGKEFIKLYSKVNRKLKTVLSHENSLQHLNRYFKGKRLSEITSEQIARYIAERRAKVSPSTVNRELSCLKCLLNKAVEWGRLETNPSARVKKFKEPPSKDRILNDAEIRGLLSAAGEALRPVLIVLLGTGMRKGEALSLRWENIDFRKSFIYVGARDSKSGRSRQIPMSALVYETLQALKADSENPYVFPSKRTAGSIVEVRKYFVEACEIAKISGVTLHTLRHTAGTRMVESGVDLATASKILGHASIQMTMRYCHPTPENMQRAVDLLAQNIGPALSVVPAVSTKKEGISVTEMLSAS